MRLRVLTLAAGLILVSVVTADDTDVIKQDKQTLQGVWVPIKVEMGGQVMDKEELKKQPKLGIEGEKPWLRCKPQGRDLQRSVESPTGRQRTADHHFRQQPGAGERGTETARHLQDQWGCVDDMLERGLRKRQEAE